MGYAVIAPDGTARVAASTAIIDASTQKIAMKMGPVLRSSTLILEPQLGPVQPQQHLKRSSSFVTTKSSGRTFFVIGAIGFLAPVIDDPRGIQGRMRGRGAPVRRWRSW